MDQNFSIRKINESELGIVIDWARREGWNPGIHDAHCFYQADPSGFFIGLLDGIPIAAGSAVIYDEHYAFCGLYIVSPEFRQHGYGIQLTQERLKYVGNRITGLDGVLDKVSKYQRLGYVPFYKNIRFALNYVESFKPHPEVVDLNSILFSTLEKFDLTYFPAPRRNFLKEWISQSQGFALGYMENQQLRGYGVIRKCIKGYKIGPLFAESPIIAQRLFETLCFEAKTGPIYLDIPEPNQNAQALVKQYKMQPEFEVIRMYRNGNPGIPLDRIYGITTFELG